MSEPFLGEIQLFTGNFAPRGWAFCDGQLLAISQGQALFSLLGTIYGGDGRTTFALPDLRGRIPVHQGSGPGLTPRSIGEKGGVETVTLTAAQMAAHTHPLMASSSPATDVSPQNGVPAVPVSHIPQYADTGDASMDPTGLTGGSTPHDNMPPFLALHFIIALVGIYPS